MKIKESFDNFNNPEWCVYDYVMGKVDFSNEYNFVMSISEVARTIYITHTFIDEVNNGGFACYYDQYVMYKEVESCLERIGDIKVLDVIKRANSLIKQVEDRIGDIITDNIQEITDEESSLLDELNNEYYDYEEELIENLRNYTLKNKEEEIKF